MMWQQEMCFGLLLEGGFADAIDDVTNEVMLQVLRDITEIKQSKRSKFCEMN